MNLIIYGMGDLGRLMRHYFDSDSPYTAVAFCGDKKWITEETLDGLPVVPFEDIEQTYPINEHAIFVAAGYRNMRARKQMFFSAEKKGYEFASFISSNAKHDSSNKIGKNVALLSNVILEPFAEVLSNTIVNSGAIVCHHAKIESHCFIAARALVGGFTQIGENSFIGFSATVLQKLTLANETLIAASSLVTKNTDESTSYLGIPAKFKSTHAKGGICILD